ncbi:MAG TPA: discoidin domain-containing protein [Vicinamibacterales bacterium]|nr:discoidin domain-containing protein [Vicinamibacterales bacterium]
MTGAARRKRRPWLLPLIAFVAYVVLAALYTHPLLPQATTRIANDRYDPVLNASILWWNATTLPFSPAWWTPPHYYPSTDIAAFTENLVGLAVVSAPIQWITGDPLLTYNLTFFLTWPLCGLAVYLLVLRLSRRHDAAFVAGLAFAFAPYRAAQLAHLQVLACFWLPLAFVGLHGFVADGRRRWLVLFGAAWLLQSLTNGYFMLFGALVIACWILYFCSTGRGWRAAVPILAAWILATLPLLPILLTYRAVHARYGLTRSYGEMVYYSAQPRSWGWASELIPVWSRVLPDYGSEATLFPGLTAVALVAAAVVYLLWRRGDVAAAATPLTRTIVFVIGITALAACVLTIATLVSGPWRASFAGVRIRVSGLERVLPIAILSGVAWTALNARVRAALARRSPFLFYVAATVLVMVLCLGPEIRAGRTVLVEHAPYSWLMWLPGFSGLRVPSRAWMLGALCLAAAGGLAYARLVPQRRSAAAAALIVCGAGVLLDGWIDRMPTATPPEHWTRVERRDRPHALLELPLGPEYDAAATFRAVRHRRPVVNGVSGYDPPHYAAMQRGLREHDPEVLFALTSLGPLDVVVDGTVDPGGALAAYVASVPGARRLSEDGARTLFALPELPGRPALGPPAAIRSVVDAAGRHDLRAVFDGNLQTGWVDDPARPSGGIVIELAHPVEAAAVVITIQAGAADTLPKRLAIDLSEDGRHWTAAWEGSTVRPALLAVMTTPEAPQVVLPVAPRATRFVRLRQTTDGGAWQFTEIRVHGPASG